MKDGILQHYFEEFRSGRDVGATDAAALFDALITESDEATLANLLRAWNEKGTTENELFAFASIMRNRMKRLNSRYDSFVDVVGTGGSRAKTFNVSTASAFVIAGAGVPVAKHGNRAATSSSGSADVLDLLGVNVNIEREAVEKCLNELGICFMFAPRFHSLSPTLAAARRSIGRPTIFNNLGPLCNPASTPHAVIGVWDKNIMQKSANVLARLGTTRSWLVHGENGLDEIALDGVTHIAEITDGQVETRTISPGDFGFAPDDGELPRNLTAPESAALIHDILENKQAGKNAENLVLVNAAAAIYVTGAASDLPSAFEMATGSVRSGSARAKLTALREATNE